MVPFVTGFQELLCEGSFVDVRISCSDHSPSDGLGSHKLVLAGVSPHLLGSCLSTVCEEEDMICILLPDYPSSLVASVLSILYYGEVWLSNIGHQVETINSLLAALGLDLFILSTVDEIKLLKKSVYKELIGGRTPIKRIKKEEPPCELSGGDMGSTALKHVVRIKKEQTVMSTSSVARVPRPSYIPTVQTATVQASSVLKCPYHSCQFHAGTIPEMQAHIYGCKQNQRIVTEAVHHVDVKPGNITIKREQSAAVKQETLDPLERKVEAEERITQAEERNLKAEDKSLQAEDTKKRTIKNSSGVKYETDSEEDADNPGSQESREEGMESNSGALIHCVKCPYSSTSISAIQAHFSMHQRKDVLKQTGSQCPVCSLQTANLTELKKHLMTTYSRQAPSSSSSCHCLIDGCDKVIEAEASSQAKLFYHHIMFDHYGSRFNLMCDFCSYSTSNSSNLKNHLMQHLDERPYNCSQCNNGFRTRRHLREHIDSVHRKDQRYPCQYCPKSFVSEQLYKRHCKLKHTLTYPCGVCGDKFESTRALRSHTKTVHGRANSSTWICDKCGCDVSHCSCEQTVKEATVFCPECGKELPSRNLAGHLHYHRQSALRPFICQECSKTFTHAASLKRHALLHTGTKGFGCGECGKQFYQKTAMETHLKSHTRDRLSCNGCSKLFLTKYLFNFHLKSRKKCFSVYNP